MLLDHFTQVKQCIFMSVSTDQDRFFVHGSGFIVHSRRCTTYAVEKTSINKDTKDHLRNTGRTFITV